MAERNGGNGGVILRELAESLLRFVIPDGDHAVRPRGSEGIVSVAERGRDHIAL